MQSGVAGFFDGRDSATVSAASGKATASTAVVGGDEEAATERDVGVDGDGVDGLGSSGTTMARDGEVRNGGGSARATAT